jgi:hypothetical protein
VPAHVLDPVAGGATILRVAVDRLCISVRDLRRWVTNRIAAQGREIAATSALRSTGTPAAAQAVTTMNDQIIELTDEELSRVSGGFLPLLGLLGMGGGLIGNLLGGIGKNKAAEADQIVSDAKKDAGQSGPTGQGDQPQSAPSQLTSNMLGESAVRSSDG